MKLELRKIFKISFICILVLSPLITQNITAIQHSSQNTNCQYISSDILFDFKVKTLMRVTNHDALSVCIIKDNQTVWAKSYGYSHPHLFRKATNRTIYGVGSITKTITATAILQLYEKGLLDLDDDINTYLPFEIRNPNFPDVPITIRSLLIHRSSNQDYYVMTSEGRDTLLKLYLKNFFSCENSLPDSSLNWIKEALIPGGKFYKDECWFDFPPNNKTAYSTMGFIIATAILENITNQTIEEYCQKHIFMPLEMKDTSFHPSNLDKERIARPFLGTRFLKIPLLHYDIGCISGGGGIRTTLEDISHFLIANLNNGQYKDVRILNESTMKMMHNTIYPDDLYPKYHPYIHGFAWFSTEEYGERLLGHGGGAVGYDCMIAMNKTTNTGIIFLSTKLVSRMFYKLNYVLAHDSRIILMRLLLEKEKELS